MRWNCCGRRGVKTARFLLLQNFQLQLVQLKHLHQALCNVNQFLNHSKLVLKRLMLWFQLDVVNVS